MTAFEIGTKLVGFCREQNNIEAINTLYSDNIVSVEAMDTPGQPDMPRTMEGIEAIRKKNAWWTDNNEVHNNELFGPFPHGENKFAVMFKFETTFKPTNQRGTMEEIGVYTVENGKITREEFFYHMG